MHVAVVEKLINNGYGLTRDAEGRVVFLKDGLPGERWQLDSLVKRKGSFWATGTRLSDSPLRATPRCPHYETCGGCSLLHVKPERELECKIGYLHDVLARIGQVTPNEIDAIDFPAEGSRIRGKFHVDAEGNIGFHGDGQQRVCSIKSCHVLPESILEMLPKLARVTKRAHFRGEIYFLTDAEGKKPILEFVGNTGQGSLQRDRWYGTGAEGLIISNSDGKRQLKVGEPLVTYSWGALNVTVGPRAFVQSNPMSWPVFYRMVQRYLDTCRPKRVWDTHAGAGFLCGALAGVDVWASEPHRGSFDQLREGLGKAGYTYRVFQGTAEAAIKRSFFQPQMEDGLIMDPPREGLSNHMRQWVVDNGPRSVLYFSCDLGSFARDIRHLSEGYRMEGPLLAMNVNPGTLRLELGTILTRK